LIRHHLYNVEIMELANRKIVEKNGFSAGTILVEDLEELGTQHLYKKVTNLIQTISARDEVSYPESIRKVYIVNPPTVFSLVWALMKPFIEERTLNKFSFGSCKDFAKEWDQIIGKENLPKYLGGDLTDELPSGGPVKGLVPPGMQKVKIGTKSDHSIEIVVKAGQTLNVECLAENKDIGFAIYVKVGSTGDHKKDRQETKYKLKKYDEVDTPIHATITATQDTTYIAYFDNRDSFMIGRELQILTYVQDPFVVGETEKK